ncbi:hypothetical protein GCM10010977_17270 [Citricoccus zhacaiensis]|uniref:Uncharacterized protein n=1 Tax=Citricoccus zhacaiensis TaxID=489142 RepID=A0ABQ2LZX4_9MICC|nr:hypothetical protein [Citricoccus zhacaiensis]GGO45172.1 hypothetical protein GCM10010977_17270 [Citricoccus zhacaiensis]
MVKRQAGQAAVGAMAASYVNAGNIGLPIALYAVGSSVPAVSVLVTQLLVLAPFSLTVLGLSLAAQRPFRDRTQVPDIVWGSVVKLLVMPAVAWTA